MSPITETKVSAVAKKKPSTNRFFASCHRNRSFLSGTPFALLAILRTWMGWKLYPNGTRSGRAGASELCITRSGPADHSATAGDRAAATGQEKSSCDNSEGSSILALAAAGPHFLESR